MKDDKLGIILTIEPHYFCALDCIHCSSKGLKGYLRISDFKNLPENIDMVRISGGEPFQNPTILNIMLNYFQTHRIVILTCGVIDIAGELQPVMDFDKRISRLEYSIYGREYLHNMITQKNSFLLTLESLLKAKKDGFNVSIRTVVFNKENVQQSLQIAQDWKIPIHFIKLVKQGASTQLPVPSRNEQVAYLGGKIKYNNATIGCSLTDKCDLNNRLCITPNGISKCAADKWKRSNKIKCCDET